MKTLIDNNINQPFSYFEKFLISQKLTKGTPIKSNLLLYSLFNAEACTVYLVRGAHLRVIAPRQYGSF